MAKMKKNGTGTETNGAAAVEIVSPDTEKIPKAAVAGNTVTVALNHPVGIEFRLKDRRVVRLNGNAENLRGMSQGHIPAGAYGLTVIPASDWEEVTAMYGRMRIFKNGLCFAHAAKSDTVAEAKEKSELRHGREAVDPEKTRTEPVGADEVK